MAARTERNTLLILTAFYAVGVAGFWFEPTRGIMLKLIPFTILGTLILALLYLPSKNRALKLAILAATGIAGFFVEYAGTSTGIIFGAYQYGPTLGPGWQSVPFLIGLNWLSLILYTSGIRPFANSSVPLQAAFAAALMTAYDVLLEPVAIQYHFWHWNEGAIPFRNYVAWFLISLIFQLVYRYTVPFSKNRVITYIFWVQAAFFALLNLIIPGGLWPLFAG